jgi:small subunit ribosomal protein S20
MAAGLTKMKASASLAVLGLSARTSQDAALSARLTHKEHGMAQGAAKKVKPRKKSVLKRIRQTEQRTIVNRANLTRVRGMMKDLRAAIGAGDSAAAKQLLSPTLSAIDRAIQKGVLQENTANRYKSRLTLAYNTVGAATA